MMGQECRLATVGPLAFSLGKQVLRQFFSWSCFLPAAQQRLIGHILHQGML